MQALLKVIVPQITPGIVSGALIAFTMSVDDFIISYFVTGQGVKNLSIMVYTMSKRVNPSINAISTLVVVIIMVALLAINLIPMFVAKQQEKGKGNAARAILVSVAAVLVTISIVGFAIHGGLKKTDKPYQGQTLRIYSPGEYIGENVIPDFEEMTGARVVLELFDSNEQMYIKVANGESYDILVPSDYMIERLIKEDLLQKVDKEQIINMDFINEEVKNLPYDPENEYSVPYF